MRSPIGYRLAVVATGLLITPLAAGLTATAAQAASAVTNVSLQVSSSSAEATNVVYSVSFMPTDPLTSGSSIITLTAAGNTGFPAACASVTDDATGSSGCGSASVTVTPAASTIVITSPVTAAAGDMVSVRLSGVTNPSAAGTEGLKVSTSSDTVVVTAAYTLQAVTAVGAPTLEVSSLSASATQVSYSLTFTSPGRLAPASAPAEVSTVTLTAPSGTRFPSPGGGYDCFDVTDQATNLCDGDLAKVGDSGSSVTIPVAPADPGDVISLVFGGVTNPATAGQKTLSLSTSSDPKPVSLSYTLAAEKPVTHAFLHLTNYHPSATGVIWSVGFTAADRLSGSSSTITLDAAAGTVFPAAGGCDAGYTFLDPAAGSDTDCLSEQVSNGGATATVSLPVTTSPGSILSLVISGVTNPGSGNLQLSTSSDPKPVSLSLAAATTTAAAVQLNSTSASATQVTYAANFKLTGPLTGSSTITLTGPAKTVFPTGNCLSGYYDVYNLTTGADAGDCYTGPAGTTVTFAGNVPAVAGDELAVTASSVASTSATGAQTLGVTTSGGGSAAPGYTLTGSASVTSPALHVTSLAASATGTEYAVTFRAANGLFPGYSSVSLSLPGVCWPPGSGDADGWEIYDDTTGLTAGASAAYSGSAPAGCGNGTTAVVTPGTGDGFTAAPGDVITIVATTTTNPPASGTHTLELSTSTDQALVKLSFSLIKG